MDKLGENGYKFSKNGVGCEKIYVKENSDVRIVLNRCNGIVKAVNSGGDVVAKRYFFPHDYRENMGIFLDKLKEIER